MELQSLKEEQFEIKCEIKKCMLCRSYIEYTNQLIIISHNHYHRRCLDNAWLLIKNQDRWKIINDIAEKERRIELIKIWFDES